MTDPGEVDDPLLWRTAQYVLARHSARDARGQCTRCAVAWPCPPRLLAERAAAIARKAPPSVRPGGAVPDGRSVQPVMVSRSLPHPRPALWPTGRPRADPGRALCHGPRVQGRTFV